MTEEQAEKVRFARKKRRGCLGWFWRASVLGLLLLAALLIWINGPGLRWAGPKVARHFLEKAGMSGDLRLGGTLLAGVKIYHLEITSNEGALERLVVERLELDYRFMEVIKGKLRGVSGEEIHVDLRQLEEVEKEKSPLDFAKLGKTLAGIRDKVLPLALNLKDVTFSMKKDGKPVVVLGTTSLSHAPGADEIGLNLGALTRPGGRKVPAQELEILWSEKGLTLDKLDVLAIAGIRDLEVLLPVDGKIAANVDLLLDGAVLKISVGAGIEDVRVELSEGMVDLAKVVEELGLKIPLTGRLTSLALDVKKIFPEWQTAEGTLEIFTEGFSYSGWEAPELSAGVTLDEGKFSAKLTGRALGSDLTISGGGAFERADLWTKSPLVKRISGDLMIAETGEVLRELETKLELKTDFKEFPESELGGIWAVDLGEGGLKSFEGDLTLKAVEVEAAPIRLNARYDKSANVVTLTNLETEGIEVSGIYRLESKEYEARQVLKDFDSARIVPWLRGAGVEVPGNSVASMSWAGSGNLAEATMRGEITDMKVLWKWNQPETGEARAPISVVGERITYDWPGTAEVKGLMVETEGQMVKLDAALADQQLALEQFTWLDGEEEFATGSGKLPVPEDFTKWKKFLESDSRPLDLTVKSQTLPLAKLRPWVKGLEQVDMKATGKVDLKIAGSLAEPVVEAMLEIRDVSVPGQKDVPKTDVTLEIDAREGRAKISAQALASGYAPAILEAEMPFLPMQWASDPESLKTPEISGTLDLPRVDLLRFQSLVPGAAELGGVAEGKMTLSGTVGDPKVDGALKLSGGKLRMKNKAIPALNGLTIDIRTDLNEVTIKGGASDVEGGNITINGKMGLKSATGEGLGKMDLRIIATGMPVVRNEFIIIRANADLRAEGPIAGGRLSGEVGIIDSVFFKDMELIPIGKPFLEPSAAALPSVGVAETVGFAVPPPFGDWTADVVVKTIDPILIRGNLGKGQVDVALRIEGKLSDPKPNGKARISKAVARLPFSTLEINEGYLIFTPQTGFDPILDIRGTAEPRPYRVSAHASGRASDPQLILTSQPPLPENEIMTLLATGTTSAGLQDSQAAASRAMQLLIEELRRGRFLFGKQLRPVLGLLDNVDFSVAEADPYDSATYNSATLKLSDKWYVTAGLGAEGDQRVLAIWRLRFR